MNFRERIEAFWAGEKSDVIPYSGYAWLMESQLKDPVLQSALAEGFGLLWVQPPCRSETPGLEIRQESRRENGQRIDRTIMGYDGREIYSQRTNNWHSKYLLETEQDYELLTRIIKAERFMPDYDAWRDKEKQVASSGVLATWTGRTPLQRIIVDYAGLENYAVHQIEFEDAFMALYDALLAQYARQVEIAAAGPGRYVMVLENFSAETVGPKRYAELILPVYEKYFPMLQSAGKVVGTHYDGQLAGVVKWIAQAPMDVIESLTPPPEGNMTLAEARAALPDKCFWSNLNVSLYELPPDEFKAEVKQRARQGAADGRRLAFEISEDLPANWRERVPMVLQALRDVAAEGM